MLPLRAGLLSPPTFLRAPPPLRPSPVLSIGQGLVVRAVPDDLAKYRRADAGEKRKVARKVSPKKDREKRGDGSAGDDGEGRPGRPPPSPQVVKSRRSWNRRQPKLKDLYWNPPRGTSEELGSEFLENVDRLVAEISKDGLKKTPLDVYQYKGKLYVRSYKSARLIALARVPNAASCPVRVLNAERKDEVPGHLVEKAQYYVPFNPELVREWLEGKLPRPKQYYKVKQRQAEVKAAAAEGGAEAGGGGAGKVPAGGAGEGPGQSQGKQQGPAAGGGQGKAKGGPKKGDGGAAAGGLKGLGALAALKGKV